MSPKAEVIPSEHIERSILLIRGQKVLLDIHLAVLYGVTTKRLNEQVRRNRSRFPGDFMFQLTAEEVESLRSQIATSKAGRGGRRYAPYAFSEQGVAMLSTVLNSERAIRVNIEIMRTFVRLRQDTIELERSEAVERLERLERASIPSGRIRRHSAAHDAAKAQQAQNRIPGRGQSGDLRPLIEPVHCGVSGIYETWKCGGEAWLRA